MHVSEVRLSLSPHMCQESKKEERLRQGRVLIFLSSLRSRERAEERQETTQPLRIYTSECKQKSLDLVENNQKACLKGTK